MEKLLFLKDTYNLTQGFGDNTFSHKGRYALDVSGRKGNPKIYAPFSGYVAKTHVKNGLAYSVWIVSNEKVLCSDGNSYYVVMLLTHPKEIENMKVNDTFKQGDYILNDGNTGFSTGYHLDFEMAVYNNKSDIKISWEKVLDGMKLSNATDPTKYMFLKEKTKIINEKYLNKIYHFKYENEMTEKYEIGRYIALYNLRVRTGPGINYRQKKVNELSKDGKKNAASKNANSLALYRKNTVFDALEIIYNSPTDIWAKTYSGYVSIVNGNDQNSKRV